MKQEYWAKKRAEELSLKAEDLRAMGYSEEAIREILEELGYGQ